MSWFKMREDSQPASNSHAEAEQDAATFGAYRDALHALETSGEQIDSDVCLLCGSPATTPGGCEQCGGSVMRHVKRRTLEVQLEDNLREPDPEQPQACYPENEPPREEKHHSWFW